MLEDNHVYVGLPNVKLSELTKGTVVDYRLDSKQIFTKIREAKNTVDLSKIKRVILYNTKTQQLLKYLDYIDPIQGKIAGTAEENISFKLYYDPAVYNTSVNTTVVNNPSDAWHNNHIGELWWDLTNAKFYNAYQGDITFSANNWNKLFETNTIDVYEWVESDYIPSEWNNLADTDEGIAIGISGQAKYGDNAYTIKKQFDEIVNFSRIFNL